MLSADKKYFDPCAVDFELFDAFSLPQDDDVIAGLRCDMVASDGPIDPLRVAEIEDDSGPRHILLDGYTRLSICQEEGFSFGVRYVPLDDLAQCYEWVYRNQAHRRNMTKQQLDYLRGKMYSIRKNQGERSDLTSGQIGQKLTAAEAVAENSGVSERTVRRNAKFAESVDALPAEEKRAILRGEKKVHSTQKEKNADADLRSIVRAVERFSEKYPDYADALRDELLAIL